MIQIRRITADDPLYADQRALREAVILRPLGLNLQAFDAALPGIEERLEHFAAIFDHPSGPCIVGTVSLLVESESVGRLMQLAVHPQRQGEGIGRRLVIAVEKRAFGELGIALLYCHAHLASVQFYQDLGWTLDGAEFTEAGLPHRRMILPAPPRTE